MTLRCIAERNCKLLSILRRELGMSSTLVSRVKWQNALFVNGESAHTDRAVHIGDEVTVVLSEQVEGYEPEAMELHILYEDEFLIALDKPFGMMMHPSPSRNTGTLANGLLHYYRQTNQPCAVHPVSRLDRDTFGVVLFAKSAHVHAKCCALHREGGIEKTYEAAVFGCPKEPSGEIDLPIARIGGGSLLRKIDPDGQRAVSTYRVLQTFSRSAHLMLQPLTGRTHQLRLHCLASGFPILGDPQYQTAESAAFSAANGLTHQQLCAVSPRLLHPMTGAPLSIVSEQHVILPET
ncbi:MAG: RluA family pseudouridine synthase [Oscillospiraceae bacterium]|nr:RluA family pseudouridine synthase [Oscillospiraceae bacterium]